MNDQDRANKFLERLVGKAIPARPYMKPPKPVNRSHESVAQEAALTHPGLKPDAERPTTLARLQKIRGAAKEQIKVRQPVPVGYSWREEPGRRSDVHYNPTEADRLAALSRNEWNRKYNSRRTSPTEAVLSIDNLPLISEPSAVGTYPAQEVERTIGHIHPSVLTRAKRNRGAGTEYLRAVHGKPPKPRKVYGARYSQRPHEDYTTHSQDLRRVLKERAQ